MPSPRSPSLLRLGLRIVGVFAVILIVVVAIGARRGVLPNFEKRVAALQAAGQPVVLSDLPNSKPLSIEHQAQLTALIQAMDRLGNAVPPMSRLKAGDPVFLETAALRQEVTSLLQSDPVVRRLRQPDPNAQGFARMVDDMNRMMLIQRVDTYLTFAGLDAFEGNRVDEAVSCLTNAIRVKTLPEPIPGGGPLQFDAGIYTRVLVQQLNTDRLQSAHLEQLRQAFQALETAPLLRNQLLVGRIQYITDTRTLAECNLSNFSTTPGLQGAALPDWLWLRIRLQLGFLDTAGCAALDEYAAQLAELDRIGEPALLRESTQRQLRFRSLPPRIRNLSFYPETPLDQSALLPKTHGRLGLIAIAIARYRLDHAGQFPSSPADLVPRYLSALPVDPYSGGPPEFGPNYPGVAIGFDRSRLTGPDAIPPTTPGGSSARLRLEK